MKPIEIHIEGYKIVISEDKKSNEKTINDIKQGDVISVPYQTPHSIPVSKPWTEPYCTISCQSNLNNSDETEGVVSKLMKGVEKKLSDNNMEK